MGLQRHFDRRLSSLVTHFVIGVADRVISRRMGFAR